MIARASISFIWPFMLWALLVLPVIGLVFWRLLHKRGTTTDEYAQLEIIGAGPAAGKFRRRVPLVLMFLALAVMLLALARPEASLMLPSRTEAVILALDVSGSMRADDIKPNRLTATQDAARTFLNEQPRHVRIGVVEIASSAALVLAPTTDREALLGTIEKVQLQKGTALGAGIIIALTTLLPNAGIDVEKLIGGTSAPTLGQLRPRSEEEKKAAAEAAKPVPPGSNTSAAIVLMSDGSSNVGPDPVKMAEIAAEKGVRIYTVGIGTPEGATLKLDGFSVRVKMDEETLKKIALTTNGDYFRAASARELKKIYENLSTRLALERAQAVEVTSVFVVFGALLALIGAMLSMLWFNRVL